MTALWSGGLWMPELSPAAQTLLRAGYGVVLLGFLLMTLPHGRRFFMSERCGTTWKYEKRLGKLMKQYNKDVAFLGVRCSANDTAESIRKFAETRNFDMPILNDEKGELSKFFKITNTPTFTLIDKKGVLRYRGSFDDDPEEDSVKKTYLADAVKAVLDSKDVAVKTTRPFG